MVRIIRHLRGNAVAYLALSIALGGTSYAAAQLPRDSVGAAQIRAGAVGASELATLPAVRVDDDTQVELGTATSVLLELDDEVFDTAQMHPGGGRDDRVRVPRTGTYVLSAEVQWAPNGNGYRTLDLLRVNGRLEALGSSLVEPRHSDIQSTVQQVSAIARLDEGDLISLKAGQASGEDLELVRGTLAAAFVGP